MIGVRVSVQYIIQVQTVVGQHRQVSVCTGRYRINDQGSPGGLTAQQISFADAVVKFLENHVRCSGYLKMFWIEKARGIGGPGMFIAAGPGGLVAR